MFLSAIGWNCRALCHHDKHLRDLKMGQVLALCKEFVIVGLCEVHGNHTQLLSYLSFCTRTHFLFSSHVMLGNGDPNLSSGGICLLVHKKLLFFRKAREERVIAPVEAKDKADDTIDEEGNAREEELDADMNVWQTKSHA